jgi:hypothetical protein
MDTKLKNALARLRHILPLQERQAKCSEPTRELHKQLLRSYVINGRILTREEIAQTVSDPEEAINVLSSNDMVVLSGSGEPVGAYPFTSETRDYKVRVKGHRVNVMCALDALAVSPMFGIRTEIDSRCRVTGDPVHVIQSGETIENADEVGDLHLGIDWGAADASSCCANSLCTEMLFLRDGEVARQWQAEDAENREIFTLPVAVEFASRFFVPLMEQQELK